MKFIAYFFMIFIFNFAAQAQTTEKDFVAEKIESLFRGFGVSKVEISAPEGLLGNLSRSLGKLTKGGSNGYMREAHVLTNTNGITLNCLSYFHTRDEQIVGVHLTNCRVYNKLHDLLRITTLE